MGKYLLKCVKNTPILPVLKASIAGIFMVSIFQGSLYTYSAINLISYPLSVITCINYFT